MSKNQKVVFSILSSLWGAILWRFLVMELPEELKAFSFLLKAVCLFQFTGFILLVWINE